MWNKILNSVSFYHETNFEFTLLFLKIYKKYANDSKFQFCLLSNCFLFIEGLDHYIIMLIKLLILR